MSLEVAVIVSKNKDQSVSEDNPGVDAPLRGCVRCGLFLLLLFIYIFRFFFSFYSVDNGIAGKT